MSILRAAVNKHPLTAFVIVTFTLSWWSIPFADGGIFPYGPFLAAVIILALTKGRAGVGGLFRRITSWRGGWYWLLIAPSLVVAYLLLALALNLSLGGTISNTSHLTFFAPTLFGLLILGGQWEEPGWTGYALPLLQDRYAHRPYGLLLAVFIQVLFAPFGMCQWCSRVLYLGTTWVFSRWQFSSSLAGCPTVLAEAS